MTAGFRLGAAMSVLLVATTGAACAGDSAPTGSAEQAPLKLTPKLSRQDLLRGQSTRVTFYVQNGEPIPKRARLESDPYPFGGYRKVGAKRFNSAAEVALRVKPDRTTRYRIVASGVESPPATVNVDAFGRVEGAVSPSGAQGIRYEIRVPKDVEPTLQQVYFYYSPDDKARRLSRVDSARLRRAGEGTLTTTGSTGERPPPGSLIIFAACTKRPVSKAFGGAAIDHRTCGRGTVSRRALNLQE